MDCLEPKEEYGRYGTRLVYQVRYCNSMDVSTAPSMCKHQDRSKSFLDRTFVG
jgi:hypothetical protein